MLKVARRGALQARTQAASQPRDLIVTAPRLLREQLAPLTTARRVGLAARFRPGDLTSPAGGARAAMATVARRHQALSAEIARLDAAPAELVTCAAPSQFLARQGIRHPVASTLLSTAGHNPSRLRTEASFAALCGASPADAAPGKQIRHRLNPGGDRHANSALGQIVMTRISCDPRTQAYLARRTREGTTINEITRCLKRHIAREACKALATHPGNTSPQVADAAAASGSRSGLT